MAAAVGDDSRSSRFAAVFFDWRGTLVHDHGHRWWITRALRSLARPVHDAEVTALVDGVRKAEKRPEHVQADRRIDTSASFHREASLRLLADSGFDPELAEAVYGLDFDPGCHPFYPDVLETLTAIHARGVKIVLVSDIHFDLRPEFTAQAMAELVDGFVLSYEHGVQKPDRRMFELALEAAGVGPADALMVGDRTSHDGGAAGAGIATLILPMPGDAQSRHLGVVLDALG